MMQNNEEKNDLINTNENLTVEKTQIIQEEKTTNSVELFGTNEKKSKKKIIFIVLACVLIMVIIFIGVILLKPNNKKEETGAINEKTSSTTTSKVTDIEQEKQDDDSSIFNNIESIEENNDTKDRDFYIYKTVDSGYYKISPKSQYVSDEGNKIISTYTCSDDCTFRNDYINIFLIHDDKSLDYFDKTKGKVISLKFSQNYNMPDSNLIIKKFTDGKNDYYYGEYKNDIEIAVVEQDNMIGLNFSNYNLHIGTSKDLIEKGTYIIGTYDEKTEYFKYEIYKEGNKKDGLKTEETDEYFGLYGLTNIGKYYKVSYYGLGTSVVFILDDKLDKITEYYGDVSDCIFNENNLYCYFNEKTDNGKDIAKIVKYDEYGFKTVIKEYNASMGISNNLITMGLTSENYYEVYDIKNNKVLYKFDKLTSTQQQCRCDFYFNFNYFDSETGIFHAFADDSSLTEKDFPKENHDPEKSNYVNMFGYEYTYNIKTGEGKVTKKADYTQQE